jgi:3-deoxy-D-manno-octulosonic acid (KDO) 8-phosphate synthase
MKGAAALEQQPTISFLSNQLALISKSLELSRFYVSRNTGQFQQPEDMLNKVNKAISIISARNSNSKSLKGASYSNNTICSKKQSFRNLLEQFNLT